MDAKETLAFNQYLDSYYTFYCKTRKHRFDGLEGTAMDTKWESLLKEASDANLERIRTRAELKMAHREQLKHFDKETRAIVSLYRKKASDYSDEVVRSGGCNPAEQSVD